MQTSLINTYIPDNSGPDDVLCNTYDKFFFHGSTTAGHQITSANATVCNLVQTIANNQGVAFNAQLAQSAITFFRVFRGQTFLNKRTTGLRKQAATYAQDESDLTIALNKVNIKITNLGPTAAWLDRQQRLQDQLAEATTLVNSYNGQITNVAATLALVQNATALAATGIGTALAFYRDAVSDHLPITVQLTD